MLHCLLHPCATYSCKHFSTHEIIFGLALKVNHFVVKSVRNLDAKCDIVQGKHCI